MKKNNQIAVLVGFLGVLLTVAIFFMIYKPYIEKTEIMEANNQVLQQTINRYLEISENEVFYKESTEAMDLETRNIIAAYASGMIREDQIMYMANLENRFLGDMRINYFNMGTDREIIYGTNEEVSQEAEVNPENIQVSASTLTFQEPPVIDNGVHMFENTIESGYEISYLGLKDMFDYIYGLGVKKNITNISLTFDSTSGLLAGSMNMNQYYLTGTDGVYSPTDIPAMLTGVENIFGTVTIDPEEPEEPNSEE